MLVVLLLDGDDAFVGVVPEEQRIHNPGNSPSSSFFFRTV